MTARSNKVLLLFFVSVAFIGTGSAETTVDGLNFEDVETEYTNTGFDFKVYGDTVSLTPEQLLSPDKFNEHVSITNYNVQDVPGGGKQVEFTSFQYDTGVDYGSSELNDLLAWGTGGGADAGSKYPANLHKIGAVSEIVEKKEEGQIFDFDATDEESSYNVSWNIDVNSHYEHIIVDYELVYSNSQGSEVVNTWQNVYSGEKPDLLAVDYSTNRFNTEANGYVDQARTEYDNSYRDSREVNVTVAFPEGKQFLGLEAPSGQLSELESRGYQDVVQTANDLGIDSSTLLDSTTGYEFKTFEVMVQEDSVDSISYRVDSKFDESGNDLRMWIEGSFGGGSGETETVCGTEDCKELFNVTEGEWRDYPYYVQNMRIETVENDVVNEMETAERCINWTDQGLNCSSYETVFVSGDQESSYEVIVENLEYHGNGEIYVEGSIGYSSFAFDNIFSVDSTKDSSFSFLENNYLYEDRNITDSNFFSLRNQIGVLQPGIVDAEMGEISVTSSSIGSGSESFAANIKLENFSHGTFKLNNEIGVRIESSAYSGGGGL